MNNYKLKEELLTKRRNQTGDKFILPHLQLKLNTMDVSTDEYFYFIRYQDP